MVTFLVPQAMFGLGVPELLIILAVVLLLFGGSRLAGLGKSSGRALREFKEETRGLKSPDQQPTSTTPPQVIGPPSGTAQQYPQAPQDGADTPSSDLRRDV